MNFDFTKISDKQLHALTQNTKLDEFIRDGATKELGRRNLDTDLISELDGAYKEQFTQEESNGLNNYYKIAIIVFPFFIEIHNLIAGRMLAKGQNRKWKDYQLYVCLGFLLWTVIVILYAKYHLFAVK